VGDLGQTVVLIACASLDLVNGGGDLLACRLNLLCPGLHLSGGPVDVTGERDQSAHRRLDLAQHVVDLLTDLRHRVRSSLGVQTPCQVAARRRPHGLGVLAGGLAQRLAEGFGLPALVFGLLTGVLGLLAGLLCVLASALCVVFRLLGLLASVLGCLDALSQLVTHRRQRPVEVAYLVAPAALQRDGEVALGHLLGPSGQLPDRDHRRGPDRRADDDEPDEPDEQHTQQTGPNCTGDRER
jgi:hypothetical protein